MPVNRTNVGATFYLRREKRKRLFKLKRILYEITFDFFVRCSYVFYEIRREAGNIVEAYLFV